MKILILGGTGAMGRHLVRILASQGHELHVTSRNRSGLEGGVKYIRGNAHNPEFMASLLSQRWGAIVDFMVYTTTEFQQRYEQLLEATEQYIFVSSARVYADSAAPIKENSPRLLDIAEDTHYLKTDEYALAKARQEDLLFASSQKNWSIIRPYITYDDERLQLGVLEKEDWLYRALQSRTIVTAKDIQAKRTTLTSGEDVSRALAALIGQESALGEAFHITCDHNLTWRDVTDCYTLTLERNGYKPRVVEQELAQFLEWRSGKYQVLYDRMYDRIFDNRKINQFIDTASFTATKEGLRQCLERFLNNKPYSFKMPNWREEALKDRVTGERASWVEPKGGKQKIKYSLFRIMPKAGRGLVR